jgi:4-carboxymuconolactone decarboxylase
MAQQQDEGRSLPADVHAESLSRLSPLRREALGEEGKAAFDGMSKPRAGGKNLAGLQGPGGMWLRLPKFGRLMGEANRYLRHGTGLAPALTEVAILATAREMHSQFEWTMHEPEALEEGVPASVIDAIKHRKPVAGLPEPEATVIELARQAIGAKKVAPDTYARAVRLFGETGVLNLAALIGSYAMTAIVLTVFDQQLHDGQSPLLPPEKP